jgi:hypothetical protein
LHGGQPAAVEVEPVAEKFELVFDAVFEVEDLVGVDDQAGSASIRQLGHLQQSVTA